MNVHDTYQRVLSRLAASVVARRAARATFGALPFLARRTVTLDGVRFYVPSADRYVALLVERLARRDFYVLEVFGELARPGMTVVDVGANMGRFAVRAAQRVGAGGRVIAIEAAPENAASLRRTIDNATIDLSAITIVEGAVGDSGEPLTLYLSEEHRGDHRIYAPEGEQRSAVTVPGIRLDDLLADEPRVDLIKIDVQGVEHLVLRGMRDLLARRREVALVMELWPAGIRQAGAQPDEPLRLLDEQGFGLWLIEERARRLIPVSVDECLARCPGDTFIDLLVRRR